MTGPQASQPTEVSISARLTAWARAISHPIMTVMGSLFLFYLVSFPCSDKARFLLPSPALVSLICHPANPGGSAILAVGDLNGLGYPKHPLSLSTGLVSNSNRFGP